MAKQKKTTVKEAETDNAEQKLDELKDKSAPEGVSIDTESLKDTESEPSKEESAEQNTESSEEVKGPEPDPNASETEAQDPKQTVSDYTDALSEIVKNHHTNPDVFSKTSDYNTLMHKIERLKSEILLFIR